MVNTNKILTVSYGTFSCTLEGFDDSFGTMKAIAEYFRDLAADDRYFGAEPPSPDAEMLARIAEREISRRVEAHRDDNTFVLRADPASLLPNAPKPAAQAPEATTNEPNQEAETTTQASETVMPEAKSEALPPAPEAAPTEEAATNEMPPEPQSNAQPDPRPETSIASLSALVAESQASYEAEDRLPEPAPIPAPRVEARVEAVSDAPKPAQDPNSVAAKLQRIRDVVSKHDADDGYSEDEHADDFLSEEEAASEDILSHAQADIAAALAADDALEDPQLDVENEDEDDISALLDQLSAKDSTSAPSPEQNGAHPAPHADTEAPDPLRARVIKMKKVDFDAALAAGALEEEEAPSRPDIPSSLSDEDEADLMRELAAVEAEAAQDSASQTLQTVDDDYDDEDYDSYDEVDFDDDSYYEDDEDDAALREDLSEITGETTGEDTTGNLFSDQDAATHQTVASTMRAVRSARLVETATDDQMGRILEETNTKLDEDEGRGRRNAIAHLRAAVQATEAERNIGGDLGADGRDTEVYRDDLETAVRPRRPVAAQGKARPDPRRAAPLKLVAEQRIDTPKQEGPVRPRRIKATESLIQSKASNGAADFADYVQSVGAQNLSEVLEAAASYMAFVQGQDAFSRPELMSKLSATNHADTSREDRLRSFGQLLRAGKIRKLGGGRFEASEDISYRPSARAAGA
ncbi:hypothetical protein [Lentibacter sp.]|uniref:hypothetical protein n=1 Tax=Lentibacter sp. TaxID=2024994 RepID=UPI003F6A4939